MLITDIDITDRSDAQDARGHVAFTSETGTCHFECLAPGQGHLDRDARHSVLVQSALDQMRRMPIHRRSGLDVRFAKAVSPLAA